MVETTLRGDGGSVDGAARLTAEQLALLPSDAEVAFYQEHGYYISKKIFMDEAIDTVVRATDRLYAGDVDEPNIQGLDRYRPRGADEEGLRQHNYASFFSHELAHLSRSPLLGAIAARLAQSPSVRLWHDQLIYKPADVSGAAANIGWHTDRQYWKTCSSPAMLTAWIPFHDCDETMGSINFFDGSHCWPDNTDQGLDFYNGNLEELEKRFISGGQSVVRVPANVRKGQVTFHNCLTIHGSGPNRSNAPRRSISAHLQDDANHYQEYRRSNGELASHSADALCRKVNGVPDYTDPGPFPTLFRER